MDLVMCLLSLWRPEDAIENGPRNFHRSDPKSVALS